MPHTPEDNDPSNWHRYFAIESNNRAWKLAVQEGSPDQDMEMLNHAHAAALHWGVVGTDLHTMRARTLLAEVHALLGFGDSALALAVEIRDYFLGRETDDWELAFVHTIHAHAAAVAGDAEGHEASYRAARSAIDAIADEEDRKIVMETFVQVPAP